jgi:hypothetical protein
LLGPGDDQLGGDDWSDAGLVEQCRHECAHVSEQFAFELVRLDGCCLDATCQAAPDETGCKRVRGRVAAAEAAAAVEQLASSTTPDYCA